MKSRIFFGRIERTILEGLEENMKNFILTLLTALLVCLGTFTVAQADDYLRIGMEAAYAPFNWTQDDDSNGAVKSKEQISMPTATMSKLLRRLLRKWARNL